MISRAELGVYRLKIVQKKKYISLDELIRKTASTFSVQII